MLAQLRVGGSSPCTRPRRLPHVTPTVAAGTRKSMCTQAAAAADIHESKYLLSNGMVDYYEMLGVDDDAACDEIKKAYRALAKECHPDYMGDRGHEICLLLNEAYETLMDEGARAAYNAQLETALADEDDGFTGEPLSKWMPTVNPCMAKHADPAEDRAVFVDENTCIGCKQCVWAAPATFRMEPEHGRGRVFAQWLDPEDKLKEAMDCCPVSCIHWVNKADLPALEYVMQNRVERVAVGIQSAGQGKVTDVFAATADFMKQRKRKEEQQQAAQRKYSAQQEAARRAAERELLKEHMGFFAHLFASAMDQMAAAVNGGGEDLKVGGRKRAQRWQQCSQAHARRGGAVAGVGGDYYLVPPDRALVPVPVYQRME